MVRGLLFATLLAASAVLAHASFGQEQAASISDAGLWKFIRMPVASPYSLLQYGGFHDWAAELRFGYEWDRLDASTKGQAHISFEQMNFMESLRIANKGFLIDPRLVTFGLGATVGFVQQESSSGRGGVGSNSNLLGYNASFTLLPEKPYTLTVFGNRNEDVVTREFAGRSDIRTENYGALMLVKWAPLESVFRYEHENLTEDLSGGPFAAHTDETRTMASYQGTRVGEVSDLNLDYEFEDVNEASSGFKFQTHNGGLYYDHFFGPYLEKDLITRLRIFDRQGRFGSLIGQGSENLRIDHTDNLTTTYDYSFLYDKVENIESLAHTGSAGAFYHIFSLTTGLQGTGNYVDFGNGRTLGYGGTVTVNYTKRIPFEGRFSAGANGLYRIDDQQLPSGTQFVSQEQHTVDNFQLIFLTNHRAVQDSIVITDEAGTFVYQEGFDYTVQQIGDLTALERIPGGHWKDSQVILVDYSIIAARDLEFSTLGRGFTTALDYKWFSLFYQHQQSTQNQLGGQSDNAMFLDDVTDQTAGGEVRWSRSWLRASALGNYRMYDSRRLAFTSPGAVQTLSLIPASTLSFNGSVSETRYHFSVPQHRDTQNILARLSASWRPLPTLFVDAFAGYMRIDDTLAPNERLYDAGLRLHYQYGLLNILPTVSFGRREVGAAVTNETRVTLTLVRKLF